MLYSTPLFIAALMATASCAPTSPSPQGAVVKALEARDNHCGVSTFVNRSSGGSPKVADCQQMARNIAGGGTWVCNYLSSVDPH
jgi:hypothetical protein